MKVYVPGSGETDPTKQNMSLQQLGSVVNGRHGADIVSAATVNLETSDGDIVDVTGTTSITAITLNDGHEATVRFTGILTLTNGASLILPGGANITTAAGDFAVFRGYAAGVVRCVNYIRASGLPVVKTGFKIKAFTRDMSLASGSQAVTGVGFAPRFIQFQTGISGGSQWMSFGQSDVATNTSVELSFPAGAAYAQPFAGVQREDTAGTKLQSFVVASFDSDGFTLTWTKVGLPTLTASITAICFQ